MAFIIGLLIIIALIQNFGAEILIISVVIGIISIIYWVAKAANERKAIKEKRLNLMMTYNDQEIVDRIMGHKVWIGQTINQVVDSIGKPADVDRQVMRTKVKEIWKYEKPKIRGHAARITMDDGVVVAIDVRSTSFVVADPYVTKAIAEQSSTQEPSSRAEISPTQTVPSRSRNVSQVSSRTEVNRVNVIKEKPVERKSKDLNEVDVAVSISEPTPNKIAPLSPSPINSSEGINKISTLSTNSEAKQGMAMPPASPVSNAQGHTHQEKSQEQQLLKGKYKLVKKLGEGGFGAAFLVQDITMSVETYYVAKIQKMTRDPATNKDLLSRFHNEALILQELGNSHGQIPALYDYFEYRNSYFLIQEYIRGKTLTKQIIEKAERNSLFSEEATIEIILSLLDVIECVHSKGVIHRDIKTDNIILRDGDKKPVLIDFGGMKQTTMQVAQQTGTVIGTPGYWPIEQQMGKALFQSDLYAVGMVALFMMTARPPHTIELGKDGELDLSFANGSMTTAMFAWIKGALRVLPQNRLSSVEEAKQALVSVQKAAYIASSSENLKESAVQQISSMEAVRDPNGNIIQQVDNSRQANQPINMKQFGERPQNNIQLTSSLRAQVVTSQAEVDGFNAIKRMFKRSNLNPSRLRMRDTEYFCEINIDGDPHKVLLRLYFNDETNLSFSVIYDNGNEQIIPLKSLRALSNKSRDIIPRAIELLEK